MKIDFIGNPTETQWDELCVLWKEAFGDSDSFLQIFHATAFHPERCCCLITEGRIAAALYWFDCSFQEKPVAYLYAIATAKAYQNQGLCHQLMQYVHQQLSERGYAAALLVPASPALRTFYKKMGYHTCTYISRKNCKLTEVTQSDRVVMTEAVSPVISINQSDTPVVPKAISSASFNTLTNNAAAQKSMLDTPVIHLCKLNKSEYALLRRQYLPADSIFQEKENLDFLETQTQFFYMNNDSLDENCLLAATKHGDVLHVAELLGNTKYLPQILQYFKCSSGTFQIPGNDIPFAMWLPFIEFSTQPHYFGFAFD